MEVRHHPGSRTAGGGSSFNGWKDQRGCAAEGVGGVPDARIRTAVGWQRRNASRRSLTPWPTRPRRPWRSLGNGAGMQAG